MGTEDEIRSYLQQGYTPKSLIQLGYSKSTIYKIYNTNRTLSGLVRNPEWTIENLTFDQIDRRYLPGNAVTLNCMLRNLSERDLYITNMGVQPEWLAQQSKWYNQGINDIIKPGQMIKITLIFTIPNELPLGEYELLFGVEAQYLPVQSYRDQILTTTWSTPTILHIKHHFTCYKIFLSHSVQDKHLVAELKNQFDNYGIEIMIGEDKSMPGVELEEKFKQMIRDCTVFIALLTESAVRSQWVMMETAYAKSINKPTVLMKEQSLYIKTKFEWTPFSKHSPPQHIFQTIIAALSNLKDNENLWNSPIIGIIGIALLSFLAGWTLREIS